MTDIVPCPFVGAKGKKCDGHIVRMEAFKADLLWTVGDEGVWTFAFGQPRSHYHLFCSKKDNHAGFRRPDSDQLRFFYNDLPEVLRKVTDEA